MLPRADAPYSRAGESTSGRARLNSPRGELSGVRSGVRSVLVSSSTADGTAHPLEHAAGDLLPDGCVRIEVYVGELRQLFNAIDASPFRDKDLDPNAEEFIVGWAREAPAKARLGLLVHLDRPEEVPEGAPYLREAVHEFFTHRAAATRQRLRALLRVGRTSLLIGLLFLAASITAGQLLADVLAGWRLSQVLTESLLIGGWVAMWRPLEIFLYDWWPIRTEARLFDRLSAMPVRVATGRPATSRPRATGGR
jgi:hypothetical protein